MYIDEWYDKTYESIVAFERDTYAKTNEKVMQANGQAGSAKSSPVTTPTSSSGSTNGSGSSLTSRFSFFSRKPDTDANNNSSHNSNSNGVVFNSGKSDDYKDLGDFD